MVPNVLYIWDQSASNSLWDYKVNDIWKKKNHIKNRKMKSLWAFTI